MYRLFVAVDVPEQVKIELASFAFGLPGAKWVPEDQFHITMHFIGEVDGGEFEDIRQTLSEVRGEEFEITLNGIGVFPPRKEPKVLWVGVDKSDELQQLRNRVGSALKRAGVELERRKFSPHLTLARLKKTPSGKLAMFMGGHNLYRSSVIKVKEFTLYSSVLTSKGAIHNVEEVYRL